MSLKRNIVANYVGQAYTIGIGIIISPLFLQYLGAESYGLVGIFTLLQAWMSLLDVGISPTLGRQAAIMRGLGESKDNFWILLKSFEAIFIGLAVLMVSAIFMSSHWLAQHWVNVQSLELSTVIACLQIMGVLIGLRWFAALYRSGINGLEDQVWLNAYNISIISLKFLGALILVTTISNEIFQFFIYQLAIGCLEVMLLMWRFYSRIVKPKRAKYIGFDWAVFKSIMPYAMGIAYTSAIWTLTTQSDKLIFSKVLSLDEFGYFTLVALATGGIALINGPIIKAVTPRMAYLYAKADNENLIDLYRDSSTVTAIVSICIAMVMANNSYEILYIWSRDETFSKWGEEVVSWLALGNAIMVIGAYAYVFQKAVGKLKWHVIGSSITVLIQTPLIYWAATNYGVNGAVKSWFIFMSIWFVVWTPILMGKVIPSLKYKWLLCDIAPSILITGILVWLLNEIIEVPMDTYLIGIKLISITFIPIILTIKIMKAKKNLFCLSK